MYLFDDKNEEDSMESGSFNFINLMDEGSSKLINTASNISQAKNSLKSQLEFESEENPNFPKKMLNLAQKNSIQHFQKHEENNLGYIDKMIELSQKSNNDQIFDFDREINNNNNLFEIKEESKEKQNLNKITCQTNFNTKNDKEKNVVYFPEKKNEQNFNNKENTNFANININKIINIENDKKLERENLFPKQNKSLKIENNLKKNQNLNDEDLPKNIDFEHDFNFSNTNFITFQQNSLLKNSKTKNFLENLKFQPNKANIVDQKNDENILIEKKDNSEKKDQFESKVVKNQELLTKFNFINNNEYFMKNSNFVPKPNTNPTDNFKINNMKSSFRQLDLNPIPLSKKNIEINFLNLNQNPVQNKQNNNNEFFQTSRKNILDLQNLKRNVETFDKSNNISSLKKVQIQNPKTIRISTLQPQIIKNKNFENFQQNLPVINEEKNLNREKRQNNENNIYKNCIINNDLKKEKIENENRDYKDNKKDLIIQKIKNLENDKSNFQNTNNKYNEDNYNNDCEKKKFSTEKKSITKIRIKKNEKINERELDEFEEMYKKFLFKFSAFNINLNKCMFLQQSFEKKYKDLEKITDFLKTI